MNLKNLFNNFAMSAMKGEGIIDRCQGVLLKEKTPLNLTTRIPNSVLVLVTKTDTPRVKWIHPALRQGLILLAAGGCQQF